MQVQQAAIDQDFIEVQNYINPSNQSRISPEVIFINKPMTINKNSYYKMFINLNYNPNIVGKDKMSEVNNYNQLDFKLFSANDKKEIKPTSKIPSLLTIDNHLNNNLLNVFEYDVPANLFDGNLMKFSYGISYQKNLIKYLGAGQINIYNQTEQSLELTQNLVLYFKNFDFENNVIDWSSHSLLTAKSTIDAKGLNVNEKYDNLLKINLLFEDDIPNEVINNRRIYDVISQIKNDSLFPHYFIESVSFKDEEDFKKFYTGKLNMYIENVANKYFYVKAKNSINLNEITKQINFNESSSAGKIFFNPYSWAENQSIILKLKIFGELLNLEIKLNTFINYFSWNQSTGFSYSPISTRNYNFNEDFWNQLSILDDDSLIKELVKYEI